MTAMSLRGYWRTLSERMACSPAMRITRLTTMASTGRFMKRSVNRIGFSFYVRSLPAASVVFRLGGLLVRGLHGVLHADRGAVAQLEDAGADDLRARLQAGEDGHLVAQRPAQLDDLLAR